MGDKVNQTLLLLAGLLIALVNHIPVKCQEQSKNGSLIDPETGEPYWIKNVSTSYGMVQIKTNTPPPSPPAAQPVPSREPNPLPVKTQPNPISEMKPLSQQPSLTQELPLIQVLPSQSIIAPQTPPPQPLLTRLSTQPVPRQEPLPLKPVEPIPTQPPPPSQPVSTQQPLPPKPVEPIPTQPPSPTPPPPTQSVPTSQPLPIKAIQPIVAQQPTPPPPQLIQPVPSKQPSVSTTLPPQPIPTQQPLLIITKTNIITTTTAPISTAFPTTAPTTSPTTTLTVKVTTTAIPTIANPTKALNLTIPSNPTTTPSPFNLDFLDNTTPAKLQFNIPSLYNEESNQPMIQMPTDPPTLKEELSAGLGNALDDSKNDILSEAIKITLRWADKNYPLVSRLLKLAHAIGRPALKQIPGAIPFFQILAEVTDYHKIMIKLEKMNLTMKEYDNHTIEDFLEDLAKNHNISLAQIPMNANVSTGLLKHPAVKGLIKEAMSTQINGTPFAITLAFLMDHLYSEIRIHQLTNSTVLAEIKKNISEVVGPFIRIQISKQLARLKSDYFGGFASLFKTFMSAS